MLNNTQQSEAKQIGYKELLKIREEELRRNMLPGLATSVKDPGTSGRIATVYSGTSADRLSRILAISGEEG